MTFFGERLHGAQKISMKSVMARAGGEREAACCCGARTRAASRRLVSATRHMQTYVMASHHGTVLTVGATVIGPLSVRGLVSASAAPFWAALVDYPVLTCGFVSFLSRMSSIYPQAPGGQPPGPPPALGVGGAPPPPLARRVSEAWHDSNA